MVINYTNVTQFRVVINFYREIKLNRPLLIFRTIDAMIFNRNLNVLSTAEALPSESEYIDASINC